MEIAVDPKTGSPAEVCGRWARGVGAGCAIDGKFTGISAAKFTGNQSVVKSTGNLPLLVIRYGIRVVPDRLLLIPAADPTVLRFSGEQSMRFVAPNAATGGRTGVVGVDLWYSFSTFGAGPQLPFIFCVFSGDLSIKWSTSMDRAVPSGGATAGGGGARKRFDTVEICGVRWRLVDPPAAAEAGLAAAEATARL